MSLVFYPMTAEIYYPVVSQSPYGNAVRDWTLDRIVQCSWEQTGAQAKEEIVPNVNITQDTILIGRVKNNIGIDSNGMEYALTNILVTNIRDKAGQQIYVETGGPRKGLPMVFEVATQETHIGPMGRIEYYKVILRRSENQEANIASSS
jgi:hypothetical protein